MGIERSFNRSSILAKEEDIENDDDYDDRLLESQY